MSKKQPRNLLFGVKRKRIDRKACISLCSDNIVFILFFKEGCTGNDSNKIKASGVLQFLSVRQDKSSSSQCRPSVSHVRAEMI